MNEQDSIDRKDLDELKDKAKKFDELQTKEDGKEELTVTSPPPEKPTIDDLKKTVKDDEPISFDVIKDDPYRCADCNEPVEMNQEKCNKCGEELDWTGE